MSVEMTLSEKVLAIIHAAQFNDPIITACHTQPADKLSQFELDLRDWGMFYGIAVGLARGEEPCEPIASVAGRALEAATVAYGQFCGTEERFHERADVA